MKRFWCWTFFNFPITIKGFSASRPEDLLKINLWVFHGDSTFTPQKSQVYHYFVVSFFPLFLRKQFYASRFVSFYRFSLWISLKRGKKSSLRLSFFDCSLPFCGSECAAAGYNLFPLRPIQLWKTNISYINFKYKF